VLNDLPTLVCNPGSHFPATAFQPNKSFHSRRNLQWAKFSPCSSQYGSSISTRGGNKIHTSWRPLVARLAMCDIMPDLRSQEIMLSLLLSSRCFILKYATMVSRLPNNSTCPCSSQIHLQLSCSNRIFSRLNCSSLFSNTWLHQANSYSSMANLFSSKILSCRTSTSLQPTTWMRCGQSWPIPISIPLSDA